MNENIRLFYWPTANGWKASIALEELCVPYDVHYINIGKGEQFREDYTRISPNNRIPAILDPLGANEAPISVFESGAILQYLGRKFGALYPSAEPRRTRVEQWLFWQVGGLGPMSGQAYHFRQYASTKIEYAIERYTSEVTRLYGVLDRQLSLGEYIVDDFSIADIACVGWVVSHVKLGQQLSDFPNLDRWFKLVMARPGVVRGMSLGRDRREATNFAEDAEARASLFRHESKGR